MPSAEVLRFLPEKQSIKRRNKYNKINHKTLPINYWDLGSVMV